MKFIRRILSHMMFIILLAGIVAIFYVRHQVLPETIVEKIDHYAAMAHPSLVSFKNERLNPLVVVSKESVLAEKQDVVSSDDGVEDAVTTVVDRVEEPVVVEITEKPEVVKSTDVVEAEIVSEESQVVAVVIEESVITVAEPVAEKLVVEQENKADEKPIEQKQLEQKQIVVADSENTLEVKLAEPSAAKSVEIPVDESVDKPENKPENKPEIKEMAVEKQPSPEKELKAALPVPVVKNEPLSGDRQAADYKQILTDARSAYIDSDFIAAIEKYKELIDLEEHEADFYGELGNVYYAMGNWSMAGEYYYEAALRLIDKGNTSQLSYLHRVIQGLDAGRAEKLSQQITRKVR